MREKHTSRQRIKEYIPHFFYITMQILLKFIASQRCEDSECTFPLNSFRGFCLQGFVLSQLTVQLLPFLLGFQMFCHFLTASEMTSETTTTSQAPPNWSFIQLNPCHKLPGNFLLLSSKFPQMRNFCFQKMAPL